MSEFIEQFLIECRELAQKAAEDLLSLEQAPADRPLIDGVFRGFHTLKGAAGIVGFTAMARLLHEAENMLSGLRAGDRPASGELIGGCLATLDQVVQWLDETETTGDLPEDQDPVAEVLIAGFRQLAPSVPLPEETPGGVEAAPDWSDALSSRDPGHLARLALRYEPDDNCFFRGEDPLELIAALPGLLVLDIIPKRPWLALDEFDPFACNLIIMALTEDQADSVAAALHTVIDQVEIRPLSEARSTSEPSLFALPLSGPSLSVDARAVLEEQSRLMAEPVDEGFAGRLGSAARVATNVLSSMGRTAEIPALRAAQEQSQLEGNATAFVGFLRDLLHPRIPEQSIVPPAVAGAADGLSPRRNEVRSLRIDVHRIDSLVMLAGELTVVKNAIGHSARVAEAGADPAMLARSLKAQHALLDRLVGELRRSVLAIRVLPLSHVFQRFPRLVREMARDLGKSVRLATEGETTEADKATVEALFEPMLHVLRNAMDHGIEPEQERRAAGKSVPALLQLRAVREAEYVIVEVSDDGRGIDTTRLREVAARKSVASPETLAEMSDAEAAELIFSPGISTASEITGVSGRGVGMDAVRSAIARLGGHVTVVSQAGQGTTVRFTLPFTVMLARVMTVEAGGQMFGIPFETIAETALVPRDRIFRLGAAHAFASRERTLPLIRLSETLEMPAERDREIADDPRADARVVIVSVAGQTGALEVDGFGERMDVMLRPLEGLLASVSGFAGTAVLGDGRVLIVLDLQELLR
jgi:two-component system chemotaxis sensor kinase CheA